MKNKCTGYGECITQFLNRYIRDSNMICNFNCRLFKCKYCGKMVPEWIFHTNKNIIGCKACDNNYKNNTF